MTSNWTRHSCIALHLRTSRYFIFSVHLITAAFSDIQEKTSTLVSNCSWLYSSLTCYQIISIQIFYKLYKLQRPFVNRYWFCITIWELCVCWICITVPKNIHFRVEFHCCCVVADVLCYLRIAWLDNCGLNQILHFLHEWANT